MRTRKSLAIVFVGLMLAGCGAMRVGLVEMSKEDVKNAEAVREAATNFLSTWDLNSGFIRGSLGPRLDEFPAQFILAMTELDELTAKNDEPTDFDLGYSLGLRVRTLEALVQDALKQFAPDVLNYLPFPLKF